jgi:hypothetical protein
MLSVLVKFEFVFDLHNLSISNIQHSSCHVKFLEIFHISLAIMDKARMILFEYV